MLAIDGVLTLSTNYLFKGTFCYDTQSRLNAAYVNKKRLEVLGSGFEVKQKIVFT